MQITRDIIHDLLPLYATNECSADSRALVDEYLRAHPAEAADLRRAIACSLPDLAAASGPGPALEPLRRARRTVRLQSWAMAAAIFFTVAPFSVVHMNGETTWLVLRSATATVTYAVLALCSWVVYALLRSRNRVL